MVDRVAHQNMPTRMRRAALVGGTILTCLFLVVSGLGARDAAAKKKNKPPKCLGQRATIVGAGTIEGTDRADVIVGSNGADWIEGFDGADRVCGLGGDDIIHGGLGNDRIDAGDGDDRFIGDVDGMESGDGRDTCNGGQDQDTASRCETTTAVP